MSNLQFTNNAATTLASSITNVATSLTVAGGAGALFPVLTGAQYFYCTLQGLSGTPIEIVKVTARSTDTFTITRAQDGTTASAFSTGDRVELRLVAAELNAIPWTDQDNTFTNTGYIGLPSGTTAQRPASPVVGMVRYNTTTSAYEAYLGSSWVQISTAGYTYSASYLIVAGGGGGGSSNAGGYTGAGAGAGGLLSGTSTLTVGTTYSFVIGSGGAGQTNGNNSTGLGLTATGGGSGGSNTTNGGNGGSGGGAGSSASAGTGTTGQGFGGGGGGSSGAPNYTVASGGGAGAVGVSGASGGVGGVGASNSITGSAVTYAGGGGGGGLAGAGAGGAGGGGAGGVTTNGVAGTANTGGGGGGAGSGGVGFAGAAGGSGVVIVSVPTANYSTITTGSPTVTTSGGNTIMKFTASGSYTA